jgi:hypothetical protein
MPRRSRKLSSAAAAVLGALLSQGCVVISLLPAYTDDTIAWDEALLGRWHDVENRVEVTVEQGEWRSYRIHYKHPVEEADFTAHLTVIGDTRFLDVMPARGVDYGAVLIPAHLVLRLSRDGETWLVSPLDYDALSEALRHGRLSARIATTDERQNVVLIQSTRALRDWLRARTDQDFDDPATFERIKP